MKDILLRKIEEDIFSDDLDIYSENAREIELENDEIDDWEVAWMKGYEDAS